MTQPNPSDPFSLLRALQGGFGLNDGPWRWSAGFQAAAAAGIPLAAFTFVGLNRWD
jgi:hypothetical protein